MYAYLTSDKQTLYLVFVSVLSCFLIRLMLVLGFLYEDIDCACENQMERNIIKLKYPNYNMCFGFYITCMWKTKLGNKTGVTDQRNGL